MALRQACPPGTLLIQNLGGYCSPVFARLQSRLMARHSTTLNLGDRAPDFSLASANSMGEVSLRGLLAQGAVVVEFLRGTW